MFWFLDATDHRLLVAIYIKGIKLPYLFNISKIVVFKPFDYLLYGSSSLIYCLFVLSTVALDSVFHV